MLGILLSLLLVQAPLMNDADAAIKAHKTWGDISAVALKPRAWTDTNWTKQVGFLSPGCQSPFTVVGEGFNTWEAAFAAVPADQGIKGTFAGTHDIMASVDTANMSTPSTIQFVIDGAKVGSPINVTMGQAHLTWDSTTVPDGAHALCALMSFVDATSAKVIVTQSHAELIFVKQ